MTGFDTKPDPTAGPTPSAGATLEQTQAYANLEAFYDAIDVTDPVFWPDHGGLDKPTRVVTNSRESLCARPSYGAFYTSPGSLDIDQYSIHFCAQAAETDIAANAYHDLYHHVSRSLQPSMTWPSAPDEARSRAVECIFGANRFHCRADYALGEHLETFVTHAGVTRVVALENADLAGMLVGNRVYQAHLTLDGGPAVWRSLHFSGYATGSILQLCPAMRTHAKTVEGSTLADREICKALRDLNNPSKTGPLLSCSVPWDSDGNCIDD